MTTQGNQTASIVDSANEPALTEEFFDAVSPLDFVLTAGESAPDGKSKRRWLKRMRNMSESTRQQIIYLFLMAVIVLMLHSDQNLLAPSLTLIATEFNMTAEEKDLYLGGYLSIAFFASGASSALIAGYLADSFDRKLVFSVIVFVGALACLCTIFVVDYWGLFATRLVTGFALGGSSPVLYSLIGDTFVDEWRGRAASLFIILGGAGVVAGQTIAALIAPQFGWRVPFAVVSIPALLFVGLFYCYVKEPKRGSKERVLKDLNLSEQYSERMSCAKLMLLFKSPSVVLLLALSLPQSLPWGFLLVYAQDFLMHDVGPQVPGGINSGQSLAIVIVFSLASAAGTILGGIVTDNLWRKRRYVAVAIVGGITTAIAAIPMFFTANIIMSYVGYCLIVIPSGFLVSVGGIAKNAMLLNCTLPETRGTAFALNSLVDDLGRGLGSFVIAMMIVAMGGRVPAFNVAFGGWILSGVIFLFVGCFVTRDVVAKDKRLIASVKLTEPSSSANVGKVVSSDSESTPKNSLATNSTVASEGESPKNLDISSEESLEFSAESPVNSSHMVTLV